MTTCARSLDITSESLCLDMEKELLKALVSYFATLEKVDGKWREVSKNVQDALCGLKNYAEQLHYVTSKDVDNAEICRMDNVREKLVFKINLRMEEEIYSIQEAIRGLGSLSQELRNKLMQLEKVRSKVDVDETKMRDIVEGNAHRPRLNTLLEWAIDGQEYYQQLYNEINDNFKTIEKTKQETITRFIQIFKKTGSRRAEIERILGFTQYLAKETIR